MFVGLTGVKPTYATGAKALGYNQNKIDHVFQAKHKLGPLVRQFGNKNNALAEIHNAAQRSVDANHLAGKFEVVVNVGGIDVVVRGNVIDGVVKIGTAFRP